MTSMHGTVSSAWHALPGHPTLILFMSSPVHSRGKKRNELNRLAEPLWHSQWHQVVWSLTSDRWRWDFFSPVAVLIRQVQPWASCMSTTDLTHLAARGLSLVNHREGPGGGGGGGGWGLSVKVVDYVLFSPPLLDVAAALRMGATPHAVGLSRVERSPVTKHRELPTISVSKSGSTSSKSDTTNVTPKSDTHLSPHKSSSTHEVQASLHSVHIHIFMYRSVYL